MRIASGVTDQFCYFVAVDSTDFTTRETGLSSFTVYRSRNGGAAAAMTTPTINEVDATNMPGVYELLLDEDMTLDAGDETQEMVFHITATGMAPVTRTIELYRPKFTAGSTLSLTDINAECDTAISDAALATAANLATVDTVVDGIQTDLSNATDGLGAIKTAVDAIPTSAAPTATENADALLNRDMSAVTVSNARSPINALRFLRNKYEVVGTTLTVYEEDDTTSAWTASLTANASADPITGSDPA